MERGLLMLISHKCNLDCKYCYEQHKEDRLMTWQQAEKILITEFTNQLKPIDYVDLIGGEPLSNFELITKICDWVWKYSPQTPFFCRTNGTLLTLNMKKWFQEHKKKFTLGLSIDGTPLVNYINRGVLDRYIDYNFFFKHWPKNPIKITIFPTTAHLLSDSVITLHNKGFMLTGDIARGVLWNEQHCEILRLQLDKLVNYYLCNPLINPIEPLFNVGFEQMNLSHSYPMEIPCWKNGNIHTYDCDGRIPCHMFSSIVQGVNKTNIMREAENLQNVPIHEKCFTCSIRWRCKNCMAMNYHFFNDFAKNINLQFNCHAHMIAAKAAAKFLILKFSQREITNDIEFKALSNALTFYQSFL